MNAEDEGRAKASFVIAEHTFRELTGTPDFEGEVARFSELVASARSQGSVYRWEAIFEVPVDEYGTALSDFLFDRRSVVDRDARQLLGVTIDRAAPWPESANESLLDFSLGGVQVEVAPSLGVCLRYLPESPWAALAFGKISRSGELSLAAAGAGSDAVTCFVLTNSSQLSRFWRDVFSRYEYTPMEIGRNSRYAFPDLTFAEKIWSQATRFEGRWVDIRGQLIHCLGGINDGASPIFSLFPQNADRIAHLSGDHGVDCSPDSPRTHKNAAAMKERQVVFEGRKISCEWHAKLEPHRNRVHFAVDGESVFVGIFAAHLTV